MTSGGDEQLERLTIPAAWVGVEDVPIVFVNQIVAQLDDHGDAFITFGQASPPIVTATTIEERREQAKRVPFVQVRPVARVSLAPRRLKDLIKILQALSDNQERLKQQLDQGMTE